MIRNLFLIVLGTLVLGMCPCRTADAGLVLSFSADGSPVEFTGGVGEEITIPVFINQIGPLAPGEPDLSIEPLITFGFNASVDPAFGEITGFSFASPFDPLVVSPFPFDSGFVSGGDLIGPPATGPFIPLGSFTVQRSTLDGFSLDLTDDPFFDDFFTDSGVMLDSFIFPSVATTYSASITVVPEPSSLVLFGTAAVATITYRRNQYRANVHH